jgi:hypothetical protein
VPRYHSAPIPVVVCGDHEMTKDHPLAREWEPTIRGTLCPFLWVYYSPRRTVPRGPVHAPRPYIVRAVPGNRRGLRHWSDPLARSETLEGAVAAAQRIAVWWSV